jgi:hypothetical protein
VKESFSPLAALLAVLFIAICPGIVFQCHILKPYTLGVMFFSACLFFSGRLVRDSSRRNYIYSGIFAGLCAGAMSVYGPVFLAPLAAHFISEKKDHSNLIYLILFSALAFCLVNPYWAIDFNSMRAEMKDSAGWYTKGITASQIIKYIFGQIPGNISWGLFIVAAAGVVYAFFSKNRILIMLLSVSLVPSVLFLYLLNQQQQVLNVSRFLLPWTVAALILGACFVDFILNSKWKAAAVILLFLFVIVPSTLHSLAVVKNFAVDASDRSTRLMAGKWIMANIPPDATIGIYGMPQPAGIPPFDFSRYKLIYIRNMQATKMSEAQYIVTINLNNNEIDQSCTQDFEILKSFDQEESILGLKFRILRSNINSRVDIFKRVL